MNLFGLAHAVAKAGIVCIASVSMAWGCTGIMLSGLDGSIVRARTAEWGPFDLETKINIIPSGFTYSAGEMPDGQEGANWFGRFGMVGISMLDHGAPADGLNEAGLSAGLFYLPGYTEYQEYLPELAKNSIPGDLLASYVLSQYETVDEAAAGLADVRVVGVVDETLGFPFPFHLLVADRFGGRIVIEYIDGKLTVFDAPLGVITNSPNYDWHMTNLNNYVNLSALGLPAVEASGLTFAPLGAGSGMIGLPGDFTPPSRFVRAVAFSQTARETEGGYDTVREAFRILDNFNIPADAAEGAQDDVKSDDLLYSATQITTAADSQNLVYYYHTMYDRTVHLVDMKQIDFGAMGEEMTVFETNGDRKPTLVNMTPSN
ncbi:linear amide C-N hydrolase [Shimia abyssi]|uniref:Choloylglycine hydrolase n=1 Tax=Shimia abyssi TaxID=1662395 RepID=A0A2P8FET3_9RHOB|nr:linear amide C-N hydrolase [Shimia abyssi]PSL20235.1 choloylglycine hydrolase [Shimia abyssi]